MNDKTETLNLLLSHFAKDYDTAAAHKKIRPRLGNTMAINYMRERQTLTFLLHPELKYRQRPQGSIFQGLSI